MLLARGPHLALCRRGLPQLDGRPCARGAPAHESTVGPQSQARCHRLQQAAEWPTDQAAGMDSCLRQLSSFVCAFNSHPLTLYETYTLTPGVTAPHQTSAPREPSCSCALGPCCLYQGTINCHNCPLVFSAVPRSLTSLLRTLECTPAFPEPVVDSLWHEKVAWSMQSRTAARPWRWMAISACWPSFATRRKRIPATTLPLAPTARRRSSRRDLGPRWAARKLQRALMLLLLLLRQAAGRCQGLPGRQQWGPPPASCAAGQNTTAQPLLRRPPGAGRGDGGAQHGRPRGQARVLPPHHAVCARLAGRAPRKRQGPRAAHLHSKRPR